MAALTSFAGDSTPNLADLDENFEQCLLGVDLVAGVNAVGNRATDNLAAVNAKLATMAGGRIHVPEGDFVVSAAPTNPTGVQLKGPGKVLLPETGGFRQLNTYADDGVFLGKEYLFRCYQRLRLGPAGGSAQLRMFVYGDSTVEGYVAPPATLDGNFLLQNLLPWLFAQQGLGNVSVTNRGVSGTNWSNLNAIPDLAATTDLLIIKYGINDGVPAVAGESVAVRLQRLATNMRGKLAAIRAQTLGALTNCSIILMGPSATFDTPNGRNEEWYEQVRQVYVQAARDYQCAYFDTYAYLRDARPAAALWMDNPFGDGRTIHPLEMMQAWIWGGMVDAFFGKAETSWWAANNFVSIGGNSGQYPLSTKGPGLYRFGQTWELARASDGFPADGLLETRRNPDTYAVQTLHALSAVGRSYTRHAADGSNWGGYWTGAAVALTLSNGWANFGSGWADAVATRDPSGVVHLDGLIRNGTTTVGTVMATLPVGYRPLQLHYVLAASSTTTPVRLRIDTNGQITCNTTGDATWTSLSGVAFRAA